MKSEQEVVKEREVETAAQQRGARQGRGKSAGRSEGGWRQGEQEEGQSSLRKGLGNGVKVPQKRNVGPRPAF